MQNAIDLPAHFSDRQRFGLLGQGERGACAAFPALLGYSLISEKRYSGERHIGTILRELFQGVDSVETSSGATIQGQEKGSSGNVQFQQEEFPFPAEFLRGRERGVFRHANLPFFRW